MKSFNELVNLASNQKVLPADLKISNVKEFKEDLKEYFDKEKLTLTIERRNPKGMILKNLYNMTLKSRQEAVIDKRGMINSACFGYYKRLFKNPFMEGEPMSYSEIIDSYNYLIENEKVQPNNCLKVFEIINSDNITWLEKINIKYSLKQKNVHDKFTNMVYKRILTNKTMIDRDTAYIILCLYCETQSVMKYETLQKTKTYDYFENSIRMEIIDLYNQWYTFFKEVLEISSSECLEKFNQVLGYMSSVSSLFIMKVTEDNSNDVILDRLEYNFDMDSVYEVSTDAFTLGPESNKNMTIDMGKFNISKESSNYIIQTALSLSELKETDIKDISLYREGGEEKQIIDIYQEKKVDYFEEKVSRDKLNSIIIDIIMRNILYDEKVLNGNRKRKDISKPSCRRLADLLLKQTNTPISIKEDLKEDIKNYEEKTEGYSRLCDFRIFRLNITVENCFVEGKFTVINIDGLNPVLITEFNIDSDGRLINLMSSFFMYFMLSSEVRRRIVQVALDSNYKLIQYKDKSKEIVKFSSKSDRTEMKINMRNFKNKKKVSDIVYKKSGLFFNKLRNLNGYIISPWTKKSNNSSLRLFIKGDLEYSDIFENSNREIRKLGIVISDLGLNPNLIEYIDKKANLNSSESSEVNRVIEKIAYINNFIINISSLEEFTKTNSDLDNDSVKSMIEFALSNNLNFDYESGAETTRMSWKILFNLRMRNENIDLISLRPKVWFFPKIESLIQSSNPIKDLDQHFISPGRLSSLNSLQRFRGNHDIDTMTKTLKSLVNKDEGNMVNTVICLLNNRNLRTPFRVDYVINAISKKYVKEGCYLLKIMSETTLIGPFN